MTNTLLLAKLDQLIAAVRNKEESTAANEAQDLVIQVAMTRNRRRLLAMLRGLAKVEQRRRK